MSKIKSCSYCGHEIELAENEQYIEISKKTDSKFEDGYAAYTEKICISSIFYHKDCFEIIAGKTMAEELDLEKNLNISKMTPEIIRTFWSQGYFNAVEEFSQKYECSIAEAEDSINKWIKTEDKK